MIKNIGCSLFLSLVSLGVKAQDIATSPYSALGYGEKKFHQGASTFGMGGVDASYFSPYGNESNFSNPAANANLLYTTFSFEGATDLSKFSEGNNSSRRSSSYLSKVDLAFPMGKGIKGGVSFQPYSAIGYKVSLYNPTSENLQLNQYRGDGGVNTFSGFVSYNINKNLALGLRGDYLFGRLKRNEVFSVSDTQLFTGYDNEDEVNGFNFVGGIAFNKKVGADKRIYAGATYGFGSKLTSEQRYSVATYQLTTEGEKINRNVIYEKLSKDALNFPKQVSLGVGYGEDFKWQLGAEIEWEETSKLNFVNQKNQMRDRLRAGIGGYYIPQYNSFRSYFDRIVYRFGGFYENTPYKVNTQAINKYGITFGFGLPIGKSSDPSQVDIGVELGQQGAGNTSVVKESFANVKISFNLNDTWFQKRQYD